MLIGLWCTFSFLKQVKTKLVSNSFITLHYLGRVDKFINITSNYIAGRSIAMGHIVLYKVQHLFQSDSKLHLTANPRWNTGASLTTNLDMNGLVDCNAMVLFYIRTYTWRCIFVATVEGEMDNLYSSELAFHTRGVGSTEMTIWR